MVDAAEVLVIARTYRTSVGSTRPLPKVKVSRTRKKVVDLVLNPKSSLFHFNLFPFTFRSIAIDANSERAIQ